jgi:hypothetical protein
MRSELTIQEMSLYINSLQQQTEEWLTRKVRVIVWREMDKNRQAYLSKSIGFTDAVDRLYSENAEDFNCFCETCEKDASYVFSAIRHELEHCFVSYDEQKRLINEIMSYI